MKFVLTTDSCCDESKALLDSKKVPWLPLKYVINGESFNDDCSSDEDFEAFYNKMAAGAWPTTGQVTFEEYKNLFNKIVLETKTKVIINLSLSTGLSSTYHSAQKGAEECMKKYPDVKIYCIDSLLTSSSLGVFLNYGIKLRDSGMSGEEAYKKLEEVKNHCQLWFVVDDLDHLKKGGRLTGFKHAICTILGIRPLLHMNSKGILKVFSKLRGTQKIIDNFIKILDNNLTDETDEVIVAHTNVPQKAQMLEKAINEKFPNLRTKIGWLGPISGSHCGLGTFGFGFIGKKREEIK